MRPDETCNIVVMYIPDFSPKTYNEHSDDGFTYLSVGWLGDRVTNPQPTAPKILKRLQHLHDHHQLPDNWRGLHACELCSGQNSQLGKGEFYIENGRTRYVLPNLVIHYITEHGYRLPDEVERAILTAD